MKLSVELISRALGICPHRGGRFHWKTARLFCLMAVATLVASAQAGVFTTQISEAAGADWNGAIWQPGAVSPTNGNTYQCVLNGVAFGNNTANTRLRNPAAAGLQTFVGDSLQLDANTELRMKTPGATLNFPGVDANPGLILNGGVLNPGDDTIFPIQGSILVASPSVMVMGDNGLGSFKPLRGIRIDGSLSGTGAVIVLQGVTNIPCMEVASVTNSFSGDWIVKAGYLKGSGFNSLGSGNIVLDPSYYPPSSLILYLTELSNGPVRFEVDYDITSPGTLTLRSGAKMLLHQNCSFSAVVIEDVLLPEGLHTYSELRTNFPATFPGGGQH